MIKRYDAYNTDPSIIGPFYDPDENGRWVEYEDVKKLEQELVDLKAGIDEMCESMQENMPAHSLRYVGVTFIIRKMKKLKESGVNRG